jgi:hypothetical protein
MATIVDTCWGPRPIDDAPYWHLVGAPWLFFNNVRVGRGALLSVSAGIEAEPHIHNAQTPYSSAGCNDSKEALFEEIRRTRYSHRPSRMKTLYVFDDYSLVQRALMEWFPNKNKTVYECRLLLGSVTHKTDTVLLNALPNQWAVNAVRYWEGAMTDTPFPEILVHGALYFPEWESFDDA